MRRGLPEFVAGHGRRMARAERSLPLMTWRLILFAILGGFVAPASADDGTPHARWSARVRSGLDGAVANNWTDIVVEADGDDGREACAEIVSLELIPRWLEDRQLLATLVRGRSRQPLPAARERKGMFLRTRTGSRSDGGEVV